MVDSSSAERDLSEWRHFLGRLGEDARATSVYKMKLSGPAPHKLSLYPQSLRYGDPAIGEDILAGVWHIGQSELKLAPDASPWSVPNPSRQFADRLHRFEWMRHLMAVGPKGHRRARELLTDWVADFGKWNGFVWRLPVTTERAWNWLVAGPILLENHGADSEVMNSLMRQMRHLQHSTGEYPEPIAVLKSLFTQLAMAFAVDEGERRIASLEAQLEFTLNDQILADGGHISRNPEMVLNVLLDLQTIDDLYLRTGRPTLTFVAKMMPRIAGMLKFLRLSDGGLPIMNGSSEGNREDIKNALYPYSDTRAFSFATKTGIHKLEAEGTRMTLDAGHAPPGEFGTGAHAGCLALELEDQGERIITNCGSHVDVPPVWSGATRRTSGHSTLAVTGFDASQFVPVRSMGLQAPVGPTGVSAKRMEEKDTIWIDSQHSGWKDTHGLVYRRRLYMDGDGRRLTGEDTLFRPLSAGLTEDTEAIPYDIRFHMHPSVTLRPEEPDGHHIRIILPSGGAWVFKTKHERKSIERTVYLARGKVEKSWQLVLSGDADPNGDASNPANIVQWAFVKVV